MVDQSVYSAGRAVTIPTGFFDITSTASANQPSSVYVVRDGGLLAGGGGSSTIFIESGGSFTGAGGRNLTVYVQQGGAYTHGNGGDSLVFYEPGAMIVPRSGSGNIFMEVADLQPSFVPVPEPSVAVLVLVGAALVTLMRWRCVSKQANPASTQGPVRTTP